MKKGDQVNTKFGKGEIIKLECLTNPITYLEDSKDISELCDNAKYRYVVKITLANSRGAAWIKRFRPSNPCFYPEEVSKC